MVVTGVAVPLWKGVGVLLPEGSWVSQIPSTRWPLGRRESQETRMPETIGKRLCIALSV